MFKNKGFEEKIKKYKKIHIYPRNNHFRGNENLSSFNSNTDLKLKFNLTQLLLDNNNYKNNNSIKNKSFMNYINSKTSLNPYYNSITQNTLESRSNNLNNNMSFNYQKINKSKSINYTAITSKKNLYDRIINKSLIGNNINKTFNNENNE